MTQSDPIIGIDLGTTNSAVAVCVDGRIEIVRENGSDLLPSVVGLSPDGTLLVGTEARNQYVVHPERTVASIKRKMGTDETVPLGEQTCSPQEISAIILRELKERAARFLGCPVNRAVITVPAYFSDAQRNATREAGIIAGLDVVRIINEPTASCLAYETRQATGSHTVLAFDFGGGTFDVSIVEIQEDVVEVIASHGDTHLGGDDIDELMRERLLEVLAEQTGETPVLGSVAVNRLRRAAESAKIRLSDEPYARILEDNLETTDGRRLHLEYEFRREELEGITEPLIDRALASVREALAAAGKTARDLDEILLVGGSTRIPHVARVLEMELGLEPRHDVHPELAVVLGAGVMAARLMGESDRRILVDITPYTFGTAALGLVQGEYGPFFFCPIIRSGTPLPVAKSEVFYTVCHGQHAVDVTVFEGDDEDARRNILIGRFRVEGLDPDADEGSPVVMTMALDLDGLLRVSATEKHTGLSKDVTIEKVLRKLGDEDLARSRAEIDRLFATTDREPLPFPFGERSEDEDDDENDDDTEFPESPAPEAADDAPELRKARVLLRRLDKAMPDMDPVDREDAEELRQRLEEAMDEADMPAVTRITRDVDDLLFYVESGQ